MSYNDCANPRDSWQRGDIFGCHSWGLGGQLGVGNRGADTIHRTPPTPHKESLGPNVTGAEVRSPEPDWVYVGRCRHEFQVEEEVAG